MAGVFTGRSTGQRTKRNCSSVVPFGENDAEEQKARENTMQLKITTDYSIRAMLYLAANPGRTVTGSETAEAMEIPPDYIRSVLGPLKRAGLITASRGSGGGWMLACPPDQITLYQIVSLSEATMRINRCMEEDGYCSRQAVGTCPVRRLYGALQQQMETALRTCTLETLLQTSRQPDQEGKYE